MLHDLGFRNASFTWNAARQEKEGEDKGMVGNLDSRHLREICTGSPGSVSGELDAASGSTSLEAASPLGDDRRFELRDLNVIFPRGELTVVTGPTASGKTALLVCCDFYF